MAVGLLRLRRWCSCVVVRISVGRPGRVSFWVPGLSKSRRSAGPARLQLRKHLLSHIGRCQRRPGRREANRGRPPAPVTAISSRSEPQSKARADLVFLVPGYIFETPVFGGQSPVGMAVPVGKQTTTLDGTLSASLGPLTVTRNRIDHGVGVGFADLFPQASLKGITAFIT